MEIGRVLKTLIGVLAAAHFGLSDAFSAEKKQWHRIPGCRYVAWQYADGDSFKAKCGSREFLVRLYYVDAPESTLRNPERAREQRSYFAITLDDVLDAGELASKRVETLLNKPFAIWTRWSGGSGRSTEPRYYAIVEAHEGDIGEVLVREGLARTKGVFANRPNGERSREYVSRLRTLEAKAKGKRSGAWKNSKK